MWDGIGALLTGAVGGGVVAIVGQSVQARRDMKKWWREQRLVAFTDHLIATDHFLAGAVNPDLESTARHALAQESRRAIGTIHLLGPKPVYDAAEAFQNATIESAEFKRLIERLEDKRLSARTFYIEAAREALA